MAADYDHQTDSLEGVPEGIALLEHLAGGDGISLITNVSGPDALNPSLPNPNLEHYQPLEYNYTPFDPFANADSLYSDCAVPNSLPSFPDTFGLPPSFVQNPDLNLESNSSLELRLNSPTDFIPHRAFPPYHAPALPLPASATTSFDGFSPLTTTTTTTTFDSAQNGVQPLQMPLTSTNSFPGGAYHNFSGGLSASTTASANVCPFAPPRANSGQQQSNSTSIPVQSHPPSTNATSSFNNTWQPILPQLPTQNSIFLPAANHPTGSDCSRELGNDDYVSVLISGDFSSSSLPPHASSQNRLEHQAIQFPFHPLDLHLDSTPQSETPFNIYNMPPRRDNAAPTAASTRPRRRSSVASTIDLTSPKMERDGEASAGIDPQTPMAPPPSRKRTRTATASTAPRPTTRRPSTSAKSRPLKPLPTNRKASKQEDVDSLFGDSSSVVGLDDDGDDVLDLTGTNEVPAELLKPKVDNRTKLHKFQCSICMDNVSGLTVTHCGHMFCSECLHSALHIDHMKKTCPICRQKVDMKARPGQKQGKNSFYHLELKLMTSNRKGKQPIGR